MDNVEVLDGTTLPLISSFIAEHGATTWLWILACLSPLAALALRRLAKPRLGAVPDGTGVPVVDECRPARWHYLKWLAVILALCTALALFWGHIQDGEMFYYNGWYIYGLFGVCAVFGAIAVSDALESLAVLCRHPRSFTASVTTLCLALTLAAFFELDKSASPTHASLGDEASLRAQARCVFAALDADPSAPHTKFLVFNSHLATGQGVAILIKRHGYKFRVDSRWRVMLGDENALPEGWENLTPAESGPAMQTWRLIPDAPKTGSTEAHPLAEGMHLKIGEPAIDPAKADAIYFTGLKSNFEDYEIYGWNDAGADATFTWTLGNRGWLMWQAQPIPLDQRVEVSFEFAGPLVGASKPPRSQRLEVEFNDVNIGNYSVGASTPRAIRMFVPAALWNQRTKAVMLLRFPDAVEPSELDSRSKDDRFLAFATQKIGFRTVAIAEPLPGTR